jgi:hypothetical protein
MVFKVDACVLPDLIWRNLTLGSDGERVLHELRNKDPMVDFRQVCSTLSSSWS